MALSQLRNCGRLVRLALQQGCQQAAGSLSTAAAARGALRPTCFAATRTPPPWHPAVHSRGFAADAGAAGGAAGQQQQQQPGGPSSVEEAWAQDGVFVETADPGGDGRQVFRLHAPYQPRAQTSVLQGTQITYEVPVWRLDGTPTERTVLLSGDVFDVPIRPDIVHRVVRWQLAKRRAGTAKAKDRSEVSGSGRKPWAQKGTGRARAGSTRAPHWRHGGVAHPPRPRDWAHDLPRKVRRLGLKSALSAKLAEGNLVVVESAGPSTPKTAALTAALDALAAARGEPPCEGAPSTLIVDATGEDVAPQGVHIRRAAGNLQRVHVLPSHGVNVYDLLRRRTLVLTEEAAKQLTARLLAPIKR